MRDVYGKRIRLTQDGILYGEEFVPLDEMEPQPTYPLWNPATNLFEITVARRGGPDLVLKNLQPQTADRLGEALNNALLRRRR